MQQERLVTLLGIGGLGKSRLAQAVAQKALSDFADGVWFFSLAQSKATDQAPDRIALAMAAAIGFPLTNAQQPLVEFAAHLAKKEIPLCLGQLESDHRRRQKSSANNCWRRRLCICWRLRGCGSRLTARWWFRWRVCRQSRVCPLFERARQVVSGL